MPDIPARKVQRKKTYPTQERVRELFDYHEDGYLIWKPRPRNEFATLLAWSIWNSRFPEKRAGGHDPEGYSVITVEGVALRGHTIVWIWHYGPLKDDCTVDHADGDTGNNRIKNLKEATRVEQARNQKLSTKNASGYVGVHLDKASGMWHAHIWYGGKSRYLGRFHDVHEAGAVAKEARLKMGFSERHASGN